MPRHIASLDGLRAIAVLLVLWCHVPLHVAGYPEWLGLAHFVIGPGGTGVELFFALSGFLITRILLAERDAGQPVRWFMLRRLLRIFPIYYLLLLIMLPFRPAAEIGWCALYLGNVIDAFCPQAGAQPLGHTWSLCVEEHFYLLWPLVVAFLPKAKARGVLCWIVIPGAVVGAAVVAHNFEIAPANNYIEHLSPFRFLTLACGALVAFAEPRLMADPRRLRRIGLTLIAIAIATHPHFWFAYLPIELEVTYWPIQYGVVCVRMNTAVLCTGVLMWCLVPQGTALSLQRVLCPAPLRAIGRISYGLYLYHLPIYHAVVLPSPTPTRAALAVGLAFAVATISYWLVERPILRYAARYRHRGPRVVQPDPPRVLST